MDNVLFSHRRMWSSHSWRFLVIFMVGGSISFGSDKLTTDRASRIVQLYQAGNKAKVLGIHNDIDWRRFKKCRICFFVDRDLSDLIGERNVEDINIFITSKYSIENYLVNPQTCKRILIEILGFDSLSHSDLEKIVKLFEAQLEEFLKSMILVMSWIFMWRVNKNRANLNNIKLNKLFHFIDGKLCQIEDVDVVGYIHTQCNVPYEDVDISSFYTKFSKAVIYRKYTRGKYLLWFLVEFCNHIHRESASILTSVQKPPKVKIAFSQKNGMCFIGGRARLPVSLRTFLNSTYIAHIGSYK